MLYSFHLSFRYLDKHSFTDDLNLHLQPSTEYAEGLLEAMASLEFMVLRRETILHSYGIPVLSSFLAFIILLLIYQN